MKTFNKISLVSRMALLVGVTFFAGAASANAKLKAGDQSSETKFCMIAGEGSKIQLYAEARDRGLSLKRVATNTECNGESIVTFAVNQGNQSLMEAFGKYQQTEVNIYPNVAAN